MADKNKDTDAAARELDKTFNSIGAVVWLVDADRRILRANRATERVFGRRADKVQGLHCYEIAHEEMQPPESCPFKPALKSLNCETTEFKRGGNIFKGTIYPSMDEAGRFDGAVHIFNDITRLKETEAGNESLMKRLAQQEKEMGDFLYLATHDMRTPLVCVQGFTENLKRDFQELEGLLKRAGLPEEIKAQALALTENLIPESLDSVASSALKIGQLLSGILKVAKAGTMQMRPETLDAGAVLKSVLAAHAYHLKTAGAAVKAGTLPPCVADPDALSRIFTNLLENAIKYRDRSRKLEIEVRGEPNGGTVVYSVADNGLGIKKPDLPRIWDIFFRGSIPVNDKGEGIGLTMVRRLAAKNNGRIWVESEAGKGSVFLLSYRGDRALPRAPSRLWSPAISTIRPPPPGGPPAAAW